MSHYSCPVCTGLTSVIETRVSKKGLRRRRRCGQDHRFTTIELPHDTGKRITGLISWLTKQGLDPDLVEYAQEELKAIMSGQLPEQDDADYVTTITDPNPPTAPAGSSAPEPHQISVETAARP